MDLFDFLTGTLFSEILDYDRHSAIPSEIVKVVPGTDGLSNSLLSIEIVDTPESPVEEESLMRDMMNRPILRSAVDSDVDIILTGG